MLEKAGRGRKQCCTFCPSCATRKFKKMHHRGAEGTEMGFSELCVLGGPEKKLNYRNLD